MSVSTAYRFPAKGREDPASQNPDYFRLLVRFALLVLALLGVALSTSACHGKDSNELAELASEDVSGELAPGSFVDYAVSVPPESYLYVGVEQYGVDLVMTLYDDVGQPLEIADGIGGARGQEVIALTIEQGGRYRLRLEAKGESKAGNFLLWIGDLRPRREGDESRAEAEQVFARATHHSMLETEASKLEAIKLFTSTLSTWRALGDRAAEATTLGVIARVYRGLGRFDSALEVNSSAIELWRSVDDRRGLAVELGDRGLILRRRGSYEEALAAYRESMQVDPRKPEVSVVLANIAWVLRDMGDYSGALRNLQKVLENQAGSRGPAALANWTAELGWLRAQLGELESAFTSYQEALDLLEGRFEPEALSGVYRRRGMTWLGMGYPERALEDFERSYDLSAQRGDLSTIARSASRVGTALQSLGLLEDALRRFDEALGLATEAGDLPMEALARLLRGQILVEQLQWGEASSEQQAALVLAQRIGGSFYEALAREALTKTYLASGELDLAVDHSEQSIALWKAIGSPAAEARLLVLQGRLARLQGERESSRSRLQRAIELGDRTASRSIEAEALFELARVELSEDSLLAARDRIEEGLVLVESIRFDVISEELRSTYLAARSTAYGLLVETLMSLHQVDPSGGHLEAAFLASERSRSRSLLDSLDQSTAGADPVIDQGLLRDERRLRQELSDQKLAIQRAERSEDLVSAREAQATLESLAQEYRRTATSIRKQNPRLVGLVLPGEEDLEELRTLLGSDTVLVEYFLGEDHGYVWLVTQNELRGFEVAARSETAGLVAQAYHHLTERNRTPDGETPRERNQRWATADEDYWRIARQLAVKLVPEELLRYPASRWTVVPDGGLNFLPIAALPDPRVSDEVRPLVLDREILVAPSAAVMARLNSIPKDLGAANRDGGKQLAVVADPVFSIDDPRVQTHRPADETSRPGELRDSDLGFRRLPFSRSEGEEILTALNHRDSLGIFDFEASRDAVIGSKLRDYRWLHFATHGVIDTERPGLSGLALSMVDPAGEPTNGFLRLYDIYHLDLSADLVVLSGCRTARGQELRGEGVIGLTRGFFFAGVHRVVASLWDVQDKATRELMVRFYSSMIDDGKPAAAALRAAQIELLEETPWSSPYYWAPFVVQGRWD